MIASLVEVVVGAKARLAQGNAGFELVSADGSLPPGFAASAHVHLQSVPAAKSIVKVLTNVRIKTPISCEQRICSTCLTTVLQGTPDQRDLVLSEEEHAYNNQMTLCCSRAHTD